ncbi:MAG TPA: hypothetical protein VE133_19685 [Candidatus Sulfotelmatobacter sp.]|nr:hypothetical protein [Candidatus Sulfotelmatobacter sp.]
MFQRTRYPAWMFLCIASLVLLFCLPLTAQQVVGPLVFSDVHHDVSPAVRDMPTLNAPGNSATAHIKKEAEPARRIPLPPGMGGLQQAGVGDSALQSSTFAAPAALAPTLNLGFEGLGSGLPGFTITGAPPDTTGAVGLNQYVQWVNTSFAVFNKTTGALIAGPTAGNQLWAGFGGGCQTNNDGDPIVLYDKTANRWVFAQFSVSTTPFLQCVAVSTTSDATGTFNRYAFQYSNFDDYPKMGVWSDAYYVTFNMFNGTTNAFVGADACAYDRTAMLNGQAATQVCFQQGTSVGGLLPADGDGSTAPPAGSPEFLMTFGTNNLNLFKFHVNFATPSASTFTGPTTLPVAAFSPLCNGGACVTQPGTTNKLDSLADRLMYRLAYRNFGNHESLVVNQSVTSGTGGGIRWYEVQNPNGTPVVAQQSTFAPDSSFRWMGSIAMDQAGDIAMGYSVSSSTISPSIRFTGRTPADPANTMETETNIIAGTGSQTGTLTRWGDYSAITVDPVDDCTFWYTTEYMKASGTFNWNTRIANFKFPGCGGAPDFTLSASPASLTVAQGGSGTSTITVNPVGGFTGSVTLSASGLPTGVTASFSTNPTTSTSALTLTASGTAATGAATVTITGTAGTLSHATTVSLNVAAPAQPDFSLSASPTSVSVTQGGTGSSTVTVNKVNGFTSSVTLSASGLPTGVTASFGTNTTTTTSAVTFTAASTAATGSFSVTVTGTSGALVHTVGITLVVNPVNQNLIVNGGFEAATAAPWTLTAGVLNTSASEPPHSGAKDAWLDGYGTTHTDSAVQTVTIPASAVSATLTFWLHIDTAETTTITQFDKLQVQVLDSANTVLATLGTFSNLNKAAGYTQRSFSVTQFKGQTVKIRFLGTEDSSLQTSFVIDDVALNVQ